ncbi:SAVED domain-containing protein [Microbacterium sp. HSID17254]|uniref:SAVED domain-containing protein n=1 Tax=Microbacterium sp. HSID17254 TaxID=2419509 RepID=UPI000F876FA2|nr:SAVED domain-containing protein [Microbacterium sp. HSID17254]RUQ07504.1 SAVED domain-containing protein [Microbacterium sp. HSID17254]
MATAAPQSAPTDVTGPIFLSYRHFDGSKILARLAWFLRASGVPVWRDQDDLPPGDTDDRLSQALADGLSGGVLVITPDVVNSRVVRQIEAEKLIQLHLADPRFQLLVANDVRNKLGQVDYGAPDRLLSRPQEELKGVDQRGTDDDELLRLTRSAVGHRMVQNRDRVAAAGYFDLTIQTRNVGQVYDRTGAQLDIRIRPSTHERLPSPAGLRDLQRTLSFLPDAVVTTGARTVRLRGGAHLSVAYALGAALPSSRVGAIAVVDQREEEWRGSSEAHFPPQPHTLQEDLPIGQDANEDSRVLAYVDLLPTRSDAAFTRFLAEQTGAYLSAIVIRRATPGLIPPADADTIASEIAARIRVLSGDHDNAPVDLILRCPFAIAVLLGRLSNTLRMRVFEWDDSRLPGDASARYVAALDIQASNPSGPITDVLMSSSIDEKKSSHHGVRVLIERLRTVFSRAARG